MSGPTSDRLSACIDHLALADPQAACRLKDALATGSPANSIRGLGRLVAEIIEALAVEERFGRDLAAGLGLLLARGNRSDRDTYRQMVAQAAENGPARAGLIARHLPALLLCHHDPLTRRFKATVPVMLQKGNYTLKAPLETLSRLIHAQQIDCANLFLDLLYITYALPLTYNRALYLTHTLPRAVDGLHPARRCWQVHGMLRVVRVDERLIDTYLEGLTRGLELLSATALDHFIGQALAHCGQDREKTERWLALASHQARQQCREQQVAVELLAVRSPLERYLHARLGRPVAIRPLSTLPKKVITDCPGPLLVLCDGQAIYLPDELDLHGSREANTALFSLLVRLEAGALEFGTFELDSHKVLDGCGRSDDLPGIELTNSSELERFVGAFDRPHLAQDLFTLCEHARIAQLTGRHYPGLARRIADFLSNETWQQGGGTLWALYLHLVAAAPLADDHPLADLAETVQTDLAAGLHRVETSAILAAKCYDSWAGRLDNAKEPAYAPLQLPFGRRMIPAAFHPANAHQHRLAARIQSQLTNLEIHTYRSDIQACLEKRGGRLCAEDLSRLAVRPSPDTRKAIKRLDLQALACTHPEAPVALADNGPDTFRYREWDSCLADYLPDHVRVRQHQSNGADTTFYEKTLTDFNGLVKRIRYAFELLRPQGLTIMRQWPEGDAFDYRALLDYALDKKAGRMPSDRLFIKRMKRIRDVAVTLLVDLSRSTANAVGATGTRVLDVEKQAIVLLCEALTVIGDRFAIAGFSGTGPLGVDYYCIKDFTEPLDDRVKGRIGAMEPLRSTRMGAAIRHAAARLAPVAARVRLIIVLGDGFPNDLEYKGDYAIEDTRRAVMEARTEEMHVKAITVNVQDNRQLDRLYGAAHHTVIGDVADLPGRLVRVYSRLTRH